MGVLAGTGNMSKRLDVESEQGKREARDRLKTGG